MELSRNGKAINCDEIVHNALDVLHNTTGKVITPESMRVFLEYAFDAGNWSGQPLVGGNVGGSKEERGNLTQLKRAGLITTFSDDGLWISFTQSGLDVAKSVGIDLSIYCDYL
jgi:hypothetical protein